MKYVYLIMLLFLTGCLVPSKGELYQEMIAVPSLDTSYDLAVVSGTGSIGTWPKAAWWEEFESPQLTSLIEEALAKSPSLEALQRHVEVLRQEAVQARARCFPLLFFDFNNSWLYLSKNGLYRALNPSVPLAGNLIDLTLSFFYEVDFWGKNRNLFRAAVGRVKAEEAELTQQRLSVAAAVAQGYYAFVTTKKRKLLYEMLCEVEQEALILKSRLNLSGISSQFDPLFQEELLYEARQVVSELQKDLETQSHLINFLMGQGPDRQIMEDEELFLPKRLELPENIQLDLIARRPDLMAQTFRLEAYAKEIGAAKADFYPNINLGSFLGFESFAYNTLLTQASKQGGLNPALHLPIYTAGSIRAGVKAKRAQFDQALFEYNDLILKSVQEIADLLSLGRSVDAEYGAQQVIVATAQKRHELSTVLYTSGLGALLETLAFRKEVLEKQIKEIELLFGKYLVAIKLIKALGGGYHEP